MSPAESADEYIVVSPNAERRMIKVERPERTRWAKGLLGIESDLVDLHLDEPP